MTIKTKPYKRNYPRWKKIKSCREDAITTEGGRFVCHMDGSNPQNTTKVLNSPRAYAMLTEILDVMNLEYAEDEVTGIDIYKLLKQKEDRIRVLLADAMGMDVAPIPRKKHKQ